MQHNHKILYYRSTEQACKCGVYQRRTGQRVCLRCHAIYMRKWRKSHPLAGESQKRARARAYLKVYVKRGKVTRKPCEICGAAKVEAHHRDYGKPLDVQWLCRPHHLEVTRKAAA